MASTQQKRKRLRNKADRLYQEYGRSIYNRCIVPGCNEPYSCLHHYFPKSTCSALRYNIKNGINICCKHHMRLHSSDDPTINNIIVRERGQEWLEELEEIKKTVTVKTSLEYYTTVIDNLNLLMPYGI